MMLIHADQVRILVIELVWFKYFRMFWVTS